MNKDNINKVNNSDNLFFLCKNNDDKCKKLIEMIKAIVLDKLLKDRSYINENNQIAESVINNSINNLTKQLIKTPYTKNEYKKLEEDKINEIMKEENDLILNMTNNGIYPTTGQGSGNGSGQDSASEVMNMVKQHTNGENINIKHLPRIGGNSRKKSKHKTHKKTKDKCKTYKKSKKIRKK